MAICVWDFTLKAENIPSENLLTALKVGCKHWAFQLEESDTGYLHYQGRISLKVKARLNQAKGIFGEWVGVHLSPTSNANRDNEFYVLKADTRKDGPWTDRDPPPRFQSRKVRVLLDQGLRPWQKMVVESNPEEEVINYIYDPLMNGLGKSSLVDYLEWKGIGALVPAVWGDATKLMGYICKNPIAKIYLVDVPRELTRPKDLYMVLEEVKNGRAYDWRHETMLKRFDEPAIWVFGNSPPPLKALSPRKWRVWVVDRTTMSLEKWDGKVIKVPVELETQDPVLEMLALL